MARIPDPSDPQFRSEVEFQQTVLDPIKVYARTQLSPQIAQDLEVRQWREMVFDRLVLELRTHLYAAPVGEVVERVPFEKREPYVQTVEIDERPDLRTPIIVALATGSAAAVFGPWISAIAFAVALVVLIVLAERSTRREIVASGAVDVAGEVELRVNVKDSFPDNTMTFPKELGQPRRVVLPSSPEIIWRDDQPLRP